MIPFGRSIAAVHGVSLDWLAGIRVPGIPTAIAWSSLSLAHYLARRTSEKEKRRM